MEYINISKCYVVIDKEIYSTSTFIGLSMKSYKLIIILTILYVASLILPAIIFQSNWYLDHWDVSWYHKYAIQIFSGKIPYVDFHIEYPQLVLIAILLPYLVSIALGDPLMYFSAHCLICSILYIATGFMVYHITLTLYGKEDRAFVALLMTITAFSATYFVLTKYDAYPTFFMVLAIYLYIIKDDIKWSYLASVIGFFMKWFVLILLPFLLVRDVRQYLEFAKDESKSKGLLKNKDISVAILLCIILAVLVLLPFFLLSLKSGNFSNLTYAYTFHIGRDAQTESIFFLLDNVFNLGTFCSQIGNFLMLGAMVIVFYMYYRKNDQSIPTLVGYFAFAIFVFVFFNKVASPQYILWFTPLFAIILSRKVMHIVWFYFVQLWMFLEFPILFNVIINNGEYLMRTEAIIFFTIKFILWIGIAYVLWKEINRPVLKEKDSLSTCSVAKIS